MVGIIRAIRVRYKEGLHLMPISLPAGARGQSSEKCYGGEKDKFRPLELASQHEFDFVGVVVFPLCYL